MYIPPKNSYSKTIIKYRSVSFINYKLLPQWFLRYCVCQRTIGGEDLLGIYKYGDSYRQWFQQFDFVVVGTQGANKG